MARVRGSKRTFERARAVLSRVVLVAMDDPILEAASTVAPVDLRSLDAIHLATALTLRPEIEAIVSYDARLNEAAKAVGFPVLTPT